MQAETQVMKSGERAVVAVDEEAPPVPSRGSIPVRITLERWYHRIWPFSYFAQRLPKAYTIAGRLMVEATMLRDHKGQVHLLPGKLHAPLPAPSEDRQREREQDPKFVAEMVPGDEENPNSAQEHYDLLANLELQLRSAGNTEKFEEKTARELKLVSYNPQSGRMIFTTGLGVPYAFKLPPTKKKR
jgi:hypothetical protein